jgi:hypothetical protein
MSDDHDQPSFSNMVESLTGHPVPTTAASDAVVLADVQPDGGSPASARQSSGNRQGFLWPYIGGLLVAVILAVAGFVFPWIVLDRGSVGQTSYSAIDLPVGNYIGVLWLAVLIVLAVLGWRFHWRWALVIGACSAAVGLVTFLGLALLLKEAPHLLPLWLLPKEARSYVPAIGSGLGPWSAFASCTAFCVWFVMAAIVVNDQPKGSLSSNRSV